MTTVPKDIQDGIKKLSEKTKVPVPDLLKRLKDIIETDENIQVMEKDDFKIRFAWSVLYKEYAMTGNAQECYFMPLLHSRPRDIKIKGSPTLVCDISALIQKIGHTEEGKTTVGDIEYGAGTFWRDGAKNLENLEKNKVYKTSIVMKENSFGYNINSDRATFTPVDKTMDFKKFFEDNVKDQAQLMKLGDIDLNESEDSTDFRVVEVTLMESEIGERDGKEYGYYTVYDDSISGETRRVFMDTRDIDWEQGSLIRMGVNVRLIKSADGTETHRMNPQWVLPVPGLSEKKTLEIKTSKMGEETVDITDSEEKKTSNESGGDTFEI
jgi:hypothetical protein